MTCSNHCVPADLPTPTACCGNRWRPSGAPVPATCCGIVSLAAEFLNALLDPDCEQPEAGEAGRPDAPCPSAGSAPTGIVEACLVAFEELGDPEAMASEDLVALLRHAPGIAVGRWRFADLTQARLAHLLAPYEVTTRDATLPDGRRRKSYRRSTLLAAEAGGYR
ncbi:DUF3631 domain-containing protein [Actinacidiphila rubida]|uniref:DUF3631 domain-containing protein n=1 Tax=Actinacidiphila rubida TaxID=310780 RepID=A0A1H8S698_9ACTN|nr:DUF3631 domain-containing protein [Actinacidiphila rubida]SEO73818.1 Protein of unknown function [Actinacidiphila rubida]